MKEFVSKNKKFIFFLIVIVLFAFLYKGYKVYEYNKNKPNKEIVTVILKNDEIGKGIDELRTAYNRSQDELYINLILTNDDYENLVHTKLANKTGIDIFQYNGKTLFEKDFIKPLSDINIDLSNVKDNSFFTYEDEIYGVKYSMAMPKIMYNNDILVEAGLDTNIEPKNLDELIEILYKIKEKNPNIIPLDVSISYIHDLFALLGTISTSENTTYPTFWNYKSAEYDYTGLEEVLEKFKEMYNSGLININFDSKTTADMFEDFKNENSAMMITNYYSKYSIMDRLEGMNLSFSNIPFLKENKGTLYYYTYPRVLVLANNYTDESEASKSHNEAVKKVYEWLLSKEVTDYLVQDDRNFTTFGENYYHDNMYDGLNDNTGYNHLEKDPTELLAGNSAIVKSHIISMIKGEEEISEGIKKLGEEMNSFIKNNSRNNDINLEYYKEN